MKHLILLFTIIPALSTSQLNVKAVICNGLKEALPLTNVVSLKSQSGTITNERGEFYFPNLNDNDSLKITNVGYLPLVIAVNMISRADTLFLVENTRQLNEITLISWKPQKTVIPLGYYNYPDNGEFKLKPGNQIALFIENTSKKIGIIQGIFFKLKQKGLCKNSLRIRLLNKDAQDPNPFLDVMNENIIIANEQLKFKNYVDLRNQRIMMPADGIFVVIELLYPETNCDNQSYTSISANMKENTNLVWLNFRDRKWRHFNIPMLPNQCYMTPNVSLELAY